MTTPPQGTLSNQLYSSRDQLRTQLIEQLKYYMELEGVDLTKSAFLSYMVNTLATLSSNILFYQSSVYREFFMTKAQIPDSILSLATFMGYQPNEASYATADVMLTIPLEFDINSVKINIPEGVVFYTSTGIKFATYYDTNITITNNSYAEVIITEGNKIYNQAVDINEGKLSFLLPTRQYEIVQQEFQIDADIQDFQFVYIEVPVKGKLANVSVEIRDPDGSSWRVYEKFDSLYLMTSTDYGYTYTRTSDGIRLHFGNGLIGVQPIPGSTVKVYTQETEGVDGNVIAGTIINGPRILTYNPTTNMTENVIYSVVNVTPATDGIDEEDIESTRRNSIENLRALGRLVSETDYQSANVVVDNLPITQNSLPILKRSDIGQNEISLFTTIQFNNDVVPTRNVTYDLSPGQTYIPRDTIINVDDDDYITMFDMTIDYNNRAAYYHYIIHEINVVPSLVRNYGVVYNVTANNLNIIHEDSSAIIHFSYNTTETDYTAMSCKMQIIETSSIYNMTHNPDKKRFEYIFDPYTDLKDNQVSVIFDISNTTQQVVSYSSQFIFRQALDDFMLSNIYTDSTAVQTCSPIIDSTADVTTVYDIPVVLYEYYNSIVKSEFELSVMQKLIENVSLSTYRMTTDFTNIKFSNTYGKMKSMLLNNTTKPGVIDIVSSPPVYPTNVNIGDRYIVGSNPSGLFTGHENEIAQFVDSTSNIWFFIKPVTDDIVYVSSKSNKYIYSIKGWVVPIYEIPLQIELEVFKTDAYTGTDVTLSNTVKSTLVDEFKDRFGSNVNIYRSELIKTVQSIEGVDHVRLITPESSIFTNFELNDLSTEELLRFGPEYIFFNEDTISVLVLR